MTTEDKKSELDTKLKAFKESQQPKPLKTKEEEQDNMRLGLRAGTELVAAIAVSGAIGYYLDRTFQTQPLFLLALLVLGVITGFVNVWRVSNNIGDAVGLGYQIELEQKRKDDEAAKEEINK